MSSFYRDIAQSMESIYQRIQSKSIEELSKEQLIELLRHVQEEAKDSYVAYSVHMGWYEDEKTAESELIGRYEGENKEDYLSHPIYQFELTDWLTKQKQFKANKVTGHLIEETNKAYLVFITTPIQERPYATTWLPKSQITNKEEANLNEI